MISIQEIERELRSSEMDADIFFRENYFVRPETIESDYEKLKQILFQLGDNGLKIPDDQLLPRHKIFRDEENQRIIKSEEDIVAILYTQALLAANSSGLQDWTASQFWESVPRLLALADNLARDFKPTDKPDILDKINILSIAETKEASKILTHDLVLLPSLEASGKYSPENPTIDHIELTSIHTSKASTLQTFSKNINRFRKELGIKPSEFSIRLQQNLKKRIMIGR